jgi:hypothetical protein
LPLLLPSLLPLPLLCHCRRPMPSPHSCIPGSAPLKSLPSRHSPHCVILPNCVILPTASFWRSQNLRISGCSCPGSCPCPCPLPLPSPPLSRLRPAHIPPQCVLLSSAQNLSIHPSTADPAVKPQPRANLNKHCPNRDLRDADKWPRVIPIPLYLK